MPAIWRVVAVLRVDGGVLAADTSKHIRGATRVAGQALLFAGTTRFAHPALVNRTAGFVTAPDGWVVAVIGFTIADGRIHEIDILGDPDRLRSLNLPRFS